MIRHFLERWRRRPDEPEAGRQSGALPYAVVDGRIVFLLVTSRKSGRWIFPKGSVSTGLTPWDSAAKEALEEAGVAGEISSTSLGTYRASDKGEPVVVDLYPLRVDAQMDEWQEKGQRLRHWAMLAETKRLLADPMLVHLVDALHQQLAVTLGQARKRSSRT